MRFRILHDIPGRMRLRADVCAMSTEQADILEMWIKTLPGVDRVTVHERTCGVTVVYHGDRRKLCGLLASFTYESAEKSLGPQPSGSRLMNREYKEKMVFLVIRHFMRRFLLPVPLRRVLSILGSIAPGDRIVIHTGHVLPLDGIIERGDVMLNQASLTGESVPVAKHPGAAVYAGSVLEEGSCVIRVTHVTGENRYDRIVRMIEESERLKSGVENRAGHLADSLVPWCLGGSILTYLLTGNTTRAVSVLMQRLSQWGIVTRR